MARKPNVEFRAKPCALVALPRWMALPLLAIAMVFTSLTCCVTAHAQLVASEATGTSSKTYRKQAISRIPFNQMQPAVAKRISDVVNSSSLYRQLPVTTIQSDPDMYLFLLRYPETIISTWKLMGVSVMEARRTGDFQLQSNDGAGTTTNAELLYGQPNLNIYYAEGEYDGPMLFRKVTGKCIIMIESDYQRGQDGKIHVTSRMNFFMKIDNLAASIIAKTIHPLVGTTADHNFVETLRFAEKLSQTSSRNGPGVQRMANRLEGLRPDVRQRFKDIAGVTWQRAQGNAQSLGSNGNVNMMSPNQNQMSAVQAAYQQATRGPTHPSAANRSAYQTQMPAHPHAHTRPQSHQRPSGVIRRLGDR